MLGSFLLLQARYPFCCHGVHAAAGVLAVNNIPAVAGLPAAAGFPTVSDVPASAGVFATNIFPTVVGLPALYIYNLHSLPMEQMEFVAALLLVLVGLSLYIYIAYLWNRWSL